MADKKQNQKEKRNAKGGGSVRKRPDGRWEARCTINGKVRSFYADKQADAQKLMRDAQKAVDEQTYVEPSKLTVGQWLDIWLEEYHKPTVKPSTYFTTVSHVKNHISPYLGKYKLQALTAPNIQKMINSMLNDKKLKPSFIEVVMVKLSSALGQAKKLGFIKINPYEACILPKKTNVEMSPLTDKEIAQFLQEIKSEPCCYKNLFLVTLFTGMRMGEITGLSWNDIDFKNKTVTVRQQLVKRNAKKISGKTAFISTTKNGKERTIAPPQIVIDALKETRKEQLKDQLAAGIAWKNEYNLVFTNKLGNPLDHGNVHRHFKPIVERIGHPTARFHDLRHTYAVMNLQEAVSPKTVQENLGHSTVNFTLNVYAHVSEKMKKESANRLQNYYEKLEAK